MYGMIYSLIYVVCVYTVSSKNKMEDLKSLLHEWELEKLIPIFEGKRYYLFVYRCSSFLPCAPATSGGRYVYFRIDISYRNGIVNMNNHVFILRIP